MRLEVGRTLFRSQRLLPFPGRSFQVAPRVPVCVQSDMTWSPAGQQVAPLPLLTPSAG